jgi:hypothetical protein
MTPLSSRVSPKSSFAGVNAQFACQDDDDDDDDGDGDGHYRRIMSQLYDSIDSDSTKPVELDDIIAQTITNNGYGQELTPAEKEVVAKISDQNNDVSAELRRTLSGEVPTEHLHTKRIINDRTPSHTSPPNDGDVWHLPSKKQRGNPSHSPSLVISGGRREKKEL